MIFSGGRSVRAPGGGARRREGMNCYSKVAVAWVVAVDEGQR